MKTAFIFTPLLLAACSTTLPVAVVNKDGNVLQGSATAALDGGTFQVADSNVSCSGTYDALSMAETITMPVACSDGRSGMVTATRDASMMSGAGHVALSDGSRPAFFFGRAADAYLAKRKGAGQ